MKLSKELLENVEKISKFIKDNELEFSDKMASVVIDFIKSNKLSFTEFNSFCISYLMLRVTIRAFSQFPNHFEIIRTLLVAEENYEKLIADQNPSTPDIDSKPINTSNLN